MLFSSFLPQIPTSFRYRRSHEQDDRRGRSRTFRRDEAELSMAIQASLLETSSSSNADSSRFHDPSLPNTRVVPDHGESDDVDPIIQPFESLSTTTDSSRYLQAVSQRSRNVPLEESSFPPLPLGLSSGGQEKPKHDPSEGLPKNTMAAHLRRQKNKKIEDAHNNHTAELWPTPNRGPMAPTVSQVNARPPANSAPGTPFSSGQSKPVTDTVLAASSSYSILAQARPPASSVHEPASAGSRNWSSTMSRISHSTSAPNLVETTSFDTSVSDFPPVSSAVQMRKVPAIAASSQAANVIDVQSANKSLIERIQVALEFDQDKYAAFKDISGEYRKGLLDTGTYLAYVEQFGLSHLVPELARLCPDQLKQKELVDTYNANLLVTNAPQQDGWMNGGGGSGICLREGRGGSKKGKGKSTVDAAAAETISSKDNNLAADTISTVRKLQAGFKPSEEGAESLSKDGYRAAKGKSKSMVVEPWAELTSPSQPILKLKEGQNDSRSTGGVSSNQNSAVGRGDGRSKQRKKTPKFQRVRLGDGSLAAHLDLTNSNPDPDPDLTEASNPGEALAVRGVWRNGGGHKLLSMTSREPKK